MTSLKLLSCLILLHINSASLLEPDDPVYSADDDDWENEWDESYASPLVAAIPECDVVRLIGTEEHGVIEGDYRYVSDGCFLAQKVYKNDKKNKYLYYYGLKSANYGIGSWAFGEHICAGTGFVKAVSSAESPDAVSSVWQEVDSAIGWYHNNRILVTCSSGTVMSPRVWIMTVFLASQFG